MLTDAAAFYLYPPVWVIERPSGGWTSLNVRAMEDEVYRRKMASGIEVKVTRDGLFAFDFSCWTLYRTRRDDEDLTKFDKRVSFDKKVSIELAKAEVMNTYLVCLYTAILRVQRHSVDKMTIAPSDMIGMPSGIESKAMSFGDPKNLALALARYPQQYPATFPPGVDWRIEMRTFVIKKPALDQSFDLLQTILERSPETAIALITLLNSACKAFEDHDYSFSMVVSWTLSEKLLQLLFESYLNANREKDVEGKPITFISTDRKKKLLDGRDFTVSVVIEILSLLDVLPFQLYNDLNRVRQARNSWIHNLRVVSRIEAQLGVSVAERLLREVTGIDLCIPLILRIRG